MIFQNFLIFLIFCGTPTDQTAITPWIQTGSKFVKTVQAYPSSDSKYFCLRNLQKMLHRKFILIKFGKTQQIPLKLLPLTMKNQLLHIVQVEVDSRLLIQPNQTGNKMTMEKLQNKKCKESLGNDWQRSCVELTDEQFLCISPRPGTAI